MFELQCQHSSGNSLNANGREISIDHTDGQLQRALAKKADVINECRRVADSAFGERQCHFGFGCGESVTGDKAKWIRAAHNRHFVLCYHSHAADFRGQRGAALSATKASGILPENQKIFLTGNEAGNGLAQCPVVLHECDPDSMWNLAVVRERPTLFVQSIPGPDSLVWQPSSDCSITGIC